MRFLARLSLIANVAFLASVWFRYQELQAKPKVGAGLGEAITLQPVVATLVILGYSAIFLNILLLLGGAWFLVRKKSSNVPRWMWIATALFALAQGYYFFA